MGQFFDELKRRNVVRVGIAVLPFVNMSSDQEQSWFADGLTEEILNSLARTPDLLVTARTSSFAYRDSTDDVPTIATALETAMDPEALARMVSSGTLSVPAFAAYLRGLTFEQQSSSGGRCLPAAECARVL